MAKKSAKPSVSSVALYHIGFSAVDVARSKARVAILSGDPGRARAIATDSLKDAVTLSENRGLWSYAGKLPNGVSVISATSGMGAPSLSVVVNELVQVGIRTIIRVGTSGSIQPHVHAGDIVISSASLCRQGAARDIAPDEYPAVGDPFLTVALAKAAERMAIPHHVGITASVDTFYEGQERTGSANPHLLRSLHGITDEYQKLNVLNYEMEAGTLFKMASVYGFSAACVCGIIAERTASERVVVAAKNVAVKRAIDVALHVASTL